MFKITRKTINWAGRDLTLETGRIARQANSVIVKYGNTEVLCTVVASKHPKEGIDFFPLTVVYQEKAFAFGKIPGGFFKREGKPPEREVLTSRLIDRALRPLFPDNFYCDTQVICTLLSYDWENEPYVPAMIGSVAALMISGIPFDGPVAASKVAMIDGELVLNPIFKEGVSKPTLDLSMAATETSIMMVESEVSELSEDQMLEALRFGFDGMQPVMKLLKEFAEAAIPENAVFSKWELVAADVEFKELVHKFVEEKLILAFKETEKQKRRTMLDEIEAETIGHFEALGYEINNIKGVFKKNEAEIVRNAIIDYKKRIDGRGPENIRPIAIEIGIFEHTHGSALFTRGETQSIVVATLGSLQDEQLVDELMEGDKREGFLLHYNFPPYSVGEVGMMKPPGRREIGHGKLAWRAMHPMMPAKSEFPYTIRVVSEITESNGSSSMATVCGTSLALMDAGVPIKKPVAGIAMGLIKNNDKFVILSDILGDEDHLGDMDFKVAGTKDGITALQMDIKIKGITFEIMEKALRQAKDGRIHILGEMSKVIEETRSETSRYAPKAISFDIPKDKIKDVIGPGGKIIKEICETTGVKINIEDSGRVTISSNNEKMRETAVSVISAIAGNPVVGQVYYAKVSGITDFGLFATFAGNKEGMVHISEINGERISRVEDVVKMGQQVWVQLLEIDKRGRLRLSMRTVNQETGEVSLQTEVVEEANDGTVA